MTDLETLRLERLVDALIAPWDGADRPGVTVGVARGDTLLVHRSAGMASIELGVPIGPETRFRIASVSKQFTCAAILLLAAEGRLSVEDDVRAHLPELAECGARITLDHLMHNSSGIRDMLEIMRLGGADLSHPARPEELMAGICRQRTLNFPPGSRYLYSNSNFLLLGRVVERVSGLSLRDFLAQRVLGPVGMRMTHLVESTSEPVAGLATGYLPAPGGGWQRAQHGFPLHGEGGLVSSVADLALWHRNCATGRVGGVALAAALGEQAPFSNGMTNGYARGLRVAEVRGLATISHGGLWPGYKTEFLRIPALDAAVIVIANNAAADPYRIGQAVLAALLEGEAGVHPVPALPPRAELARHVGRFLDRDAPASVEFSLAESGALAGSTNGVAFGVKMLADGRLAADRSAPDWSMRLAEDGASLAVELDAGAVATYHRIEPGAPPPADLPGTYLSEEMAARWHFAAGTGGAIALSVAGPLCNAGPWPVEGLEGDIFRVYTPGTLFRGWQDIRAVRDSGGRITGLHLNGGRVKRLDFVRVGEGDAAMITPDYVRMMAAYNAEMNRRLYAAAARLPPAALVLERGAFFGSILATLNHLLWADRIWMHRFAGWARPEGGIAGGTALFDALAPLAAARVEADRDILAWAETVQAVWLGGSLGWFSGATQRQMQRPTSQLVVHMFNHQTHHRGQVHAMLTAAGEQTGDTDLPFILP